MWVVDWRCGASGRAMEIEGATSDRITEDEDAGNRAGRGRQGCALEMGNSESNLGYVTSNLTSTKHLQTRSGKGSQGAREREGEFDADAGVLDG